MADHQNKHIREAIEYAIQSGWRFEKAAGIARRAVDNCPHGGNTA